MRHPLLPATRPSRATTVALLACFVLLAAASCSVTPPPRVVASPPDAGVVVFVPGITGTELRYRDTGDTAWGTGHDLLFPRDGGYAIALPIDPRDPRREALVAGAPLERISLFHLARKPIYAPLFAWFEEHGYRRGSLDDPQPGKTFFPFPYDWRRDNVETARQLLDDLEALRARRGVDRLPVDLICQSNGAHVCRYLAKYGGAELEDAAAGRAGSPARIDIRRLILVGTSNGGSLRLLRMLDRGRSYLGSVGRRWSPEALFTLPALYQDLPAYRPRPFIDPAGHPLDLELFDPETWVRYGFSVFDERVRRRLAGRDDPGLFGDEEAREAFVGEQLARAAEIHRLLHRDPPGYRPPAIFLIQNAYRETPERAVLDLEGKEPRLYFAGDPEVDRSPVLHALAAGPGDEHATVTSQMWLSPAELGALAAEPLYVHGGHFELILSLAAKERLVEILHGPPPERP